MKALVVYDSVHGNTEKVAQMVGEVIGAQVHLVSKINPADLAGYDLLVFGSPTHGGFPTEGIHNLLKGSLALNGINTAAFDTRTKTTIFGYAAPKMARNLEKNGGKLLLPPEGFYVGGIEGPLLVSELEHAGTWAQGLVR